MNINPPPRQVQRAKPFRRMRTRILATKMYEFIAGLIADTFEPLDCRSFQSATMRQTSTKRLKWNNLVISTITAYSRSMKVTRNRMI